MSRNIWPTPTANKPTVWIDVPLANSSSLRSASSSRWSCINKNTKHAICICLNLSYLHRLEWVRTVDDLSFFLSFLSCQFILVWFTDLLVSALPQTSLLFPLLCPNSLRSSPLSSPPTRSTVCTNPRILFQGISFECNYSPLVLRALNHQAIVDCMIQTIELDDYHGSVHVVDGIYVIQKLTSTAKHDVEFSSSFLINTLRWPTFDFMNLVSDNLTGGTC